ncbi:MAG: tRNA uridine-5-carboxymethylaminomethyl(34) synthesis GTPase MnmE [Steroidobacteraceae bacterium]|jgi:tRNA modification GTPase|nr:tRNA uridine-5-carboxymethylaminomethyl(34) synthesis GTPase MnmE [Steroidobacteraceae bacterium]
MDTIAAPATPPGRGGIGIVRVCGPRAAAIAAALLGRVPNPRRATLSAFLDAAGEPIDAGIALFFPGPASFTGEDVLELHGHGGPVVMQLLMARVVELGARPARPGEFTERAFFAGKVDLAQAEAVADLIEAGSAQAARAAMRSLQGEFSREVESLATAVTELRVYVEAAIDFPDEDVEFLGSAEVAGRLADIEGRFDRVGHAAAQGRLLRDGLHVVIAGKPNAGKSSLLNRLAGHEAAIVTETPGTTRDVLRERIDIDGLPLHVVDTAGLRETDDVVEGEGVRRARAEIARADLVLYLADATQAPSPASLRAELEALPAGVPVLLAWNKADLMEGVAGQSYFKGENATAASSPALVISARTGFGLDELRARLKERAGYEQGGTGAFSARARHVEALGRARAHFERARDMLAARSSFELVAEELRLGHDALGEITGAVSSDDLLGRIFGSFCIGK